MSSQLVTICCVLTPAHRRLFQHNYSLTNRLNPGVPIHWQVVENVGLPIDYAVWKSIMQRHPGEKHTKRYDRYCEALADGLGETAATADRSVHRGYTIRDVADELRRRHRDDPSIDDTIERLIVTTDDRAQKLAGSYHHAFGLSRAVAAASGRFVVLLDPDFYVVRPDWLVEVINHMVRNRIGIFGAPWHPFWFNKFRDFPCSHFMVIDRTRVGIEPDDVIPDLMYDVRLPNDPVMREWACADGNPPPGFLRRMVTLPALLAADFRQRPLMGQSRDTGFRIHAKHADAGLHECVTPVIGDMTAADLKPPVVSPFQLCLDRFYPRARRYWPRDRVLGVRGGFEHRGLPSVRPLGWEEFVWCGAPFAFHVRGQLLRIGGNTLDIVHLKEILSGVGVGPTELDSAA